MDKFEVQQALFGYSKGHRLLASSVELDAEANRLLRTATDVAFEGESKTYFAGIPLPSMGMYAFVRTWSANGWARPGSVWSHVLLVDQVLLGQLSEPSTIRSMFRRPKIESEKQFASEVAKYRERIRAAEEKAKRAEPDLEFAMETLGLLYGSGETIRCIVRDPGALESTLLEIHFQQWPRLRRNFSYRTRYRSTEATWKVDLEVVERASADSRPLPATGKWLPVLLDDLKSPNPELRNFLHRYGAESAAGRTDFPRLVDLFEGTVRGTFSPVQVIRIVKETFPKPIQMRGLKKDLLGERKRDALTAWPGSDSARLRMALELGESANFEDLELGKRFGALARAGKSSDLSALSAFDLAELPTSHVETLVSELAEHSSVPSALAIAKAQPDLGLLIASRRPDLLQAPELWQEIDGELLIDVFEAASDSAQREVLQSLLAGAGVEALAFICRRAPHRWWDLLLESASHIKSGAQLARDSKVLRDTLDRIGAAALGDPSKPPKASSEVLLTLLSANLSAGLWRKVAPADWVREARTVGQRPLTKDMSRLATDRLFAVALLISTSSGNPAIRSEGWRATFPYLHEALKTSEFDGEAWAVLANALPAGPYWDRCNRLRSGAVQEIQRDQWDQKDIADLTRAAGAFGGEIKEALRAAQARQHKRGLLSDFLGLFR